MLDLRGQVTSRWHPQLVLCEPDIEDEDELRFAHIRGTELFEVGMHVDESRGKREGSDTPFGRVTWIPV